MEAAILAVVLVVIVLLVLAVIFMAWVLTESHHQEAERADRQRQRDHDDRVLLLRYAFAKNPQDVAMMARAESEAQMATMFDAMTDGVTYDLDDVTGEPQVPLGL